jgi:phosphatidylglycerol---prolipoprotein diacylglyceryl transferase
VIGYLAWVAVGLLAGFAAGRWQGDVAQLGPELRSRLLLAAAGGAILGAYGLQLPADIFGWNAPAPPGLGGDRAPLGGRTVLGGLLGGWVAVEWAKRRLNVNRPTGDGFALPLALALGFGRLGCLTAGCCAGAPCDPAWWATVDHDGTPRVPVQAIEAVFHFAAAIALAIDVHRNRERLTHGTRLAAYLAVLAALRFALEFWRQHPRIAFGLTWHQLLAIALFGLAAATWLRRRRSRGADAIARQDAARAAPYATDAQRD